MYHKVDAHVPARRGGPFAHARSGGVRTQLAWLRAHRIRTLTMTELATHLARGGPPRNAVVLTFDDGYRDAAEVVTPLLLKYGARASFYVSAGFVGDGRHATWAQLRAMRAAGMEIGCHGTLHLDLAKVSRTAAAARSRPLRRGAGRYRRAADDVRVPGGQVERETLALMRWSGIKAALTEHPGIVRSLAAAVHASAAAPSPRRYGSRLVRGAGDAVKSAK